MNLATNIIYNKSGPLKINFLEKESTKLYQSKVQLRADFTKVQWVNARNQG